MDELDMLIPVNRYMIDPKRFMWIYEDEFEWAETVPNWYPLHMPWIEWS